MRVTVLGSSASYAGAGQACAGHLVEAGDTRVLLDCGNGVLANLAKIADPLTLSAVFITHSHPDHFCDLYALQALLRYAPEGPASALDLYLPDGLFERMSCLLSQRGAEQFVEAFVPHTLTEDAWYEVGALSIRPHRVDHTPPSFCFCVEADGARLVYTGDTAANDGALVAAAGADLLLSEATMPERFKDAAPHMAASQAGYMAREAHAGELVLTHVWPTNDRAEMARIAEEAFGGKVTVASELDTFDVQPRKGER
jgi:ribonuclease BN (tRNA processing enzyme)